MGLLMSAALLSSLTTAVPSAAAVEGFESLLAPFECGSEWSGGTRSGHGLNDWNLDINRTSRTFSDPQHDLGQPLLAQADGVVTWVGLQTNAGTYLDIDYGDYTVRYIHMVHGSIPTHLDEIGAPVAVGELIGLLGDTGNATHAHLHLEYFDSRGQEAQRIWLIPDDKQVQIAMAGELIDPGETFVSTNCGNTVVDPGLAEHVNSLATADGRATGSEAAAAARTYLIEQLQPHSEALDGTTDADAYEVPFATGTNVIARIPGSDLASDIVVIGTHYDTAADCDGDNDPLTSTPCPGATNNAAGTALLLELVQALATADTAPRRTIMFAFWDRTGSATTGAEAWAAANSPGVVDDVVAYIDYDIQGANLSVELRATTFAVGAGTGGSTLAEALTVAGTASLALAVTRLDSVTELTVDAASFVELGVPAIGFTDRTTACPGSTADVAGLVDVDKLGRQLSTGNALVSRLSTIDAVPVFVPAGGPSPADAAALLPLVTRAGLSGLAEFEALTTIVAASPSALDATQMTAVTDAFSAFDARLAEEGCSGHLAPAPFTDMSAHSFALADVGLLYDLEITTGTSATTYSPDNYVTREQMAAFLARLWQALNPGYPQPARDHPFTDIDPNSFALAAIDLIHDLKITTGTSATTYSPDNYVTREQMAAFLARLLRAAGAG